MDPRAATAPGEGDVHLGGWLQGDLGKVWLELVWVLPNRLQPAAMALARMHGQHAVFDLAHRQLVTIDADGRSTRVDDHLPPAPDRSR